MAKQTKAKATKPKAQAKPKAAPKAKPVKAVELKEFDDLVGLESKHLKKGKTYPNVPRESAEQLIKTGQAKLA